ncbi:hypothetical protein RB195_024749 [Necator americanus]|uniref:Reverse transcriptase domain-containing protein n=1 Tax=Necator americanus TaxID=51031 RepID=A0ABR1EPF6_NECAM
MEEFGSTSTRCAFIRLRDSRGRELWITLNPLSTRLLNALRADGVPGKFVRLLDEMNQRTTAAVRTPFQVVKGARQGLVAEPLLFNFASSTSCGEQPISVLPTSCCHLTDLEYAVDVLIFAESSTKLQYVVNLASKLAAAYELRLRPNKCKQMLSEKIEKVGQSYVRGRHTSAKMPIIASGDDICSPIKSSKSSQLSDDVGAVQVNIEKHLGEALGADLGNAALAEL